MSIESMDPELGTLTFEALDLPPGLEADSTTGTISGTVPSGALDCFPTPSPFVVGTTPPPPKPPR